MSLNEKKQNYGQIKAANFIIDHHKSLTEKNAIDLYSTHNEGQSIVLNDLLKP